MFRFELCSLATLTGGEEGCICTRDGIVFALLVQVEHEPGKLGWFLQHGFGPCDQQGLTFRDFREVEDWVESRL